MNNTDNILSYARILKDRTDFRRSGTRSGSEFNLFDTPTLKFFKILFYFNGKSEYETDDTQASGFLAPTWRSIESKITSGDTTGLTKGWYGYNSAYAYLKLNDENERAEKLRQFITLLSNINSESPWYFSTVSGLDSAMERKAATDGKLDMSEVKRIQIKCIPDAVDDRIGTLLSLYRDIVWSWSMKREIVPVNLRKFDMAIYIFEAPMHFLMKEEDVIDGKSEFKPSYKMIEFHNCEFDYNSIKSGYSELNNLTGTQPTYTIDIMYDDCYEVSYNNIMMRTIGDVVLTDTARTCLINGDSINGYNSSEQTDDIHQMDELNKRLNSTDSGPFSQIGGAIKKELNSLLNRALLGNIYTYSLTQIDAELDSLMEGNLIKAGQTAKQYIKNAQQRAAIRNKDRKKPSGNLYGSVEELVKGKPTGDIYPDEVTRKEHQIRDIYSEEVTRKEHQMRDIYSEEVTRKEHQIRDIYSEEVTRKEHQMRDIYPDVLPPQPQKLGNLYKGSIANN